MENNFQQIIKRAVEIRQKYSQSDTKQWAVEQCFMGMVKDVGDLSKLLMVKGGYRKGVAKDTKKNLEHELADVLYSVIVIANKTGVNLEKSFWQVMDELEERLK